LKTSGARDKNREAHEETLRPTKIPEIPKERGPMNA